MNTIEERAREEAIRCTTISFGCGEEAVSEFQKILLTFAAAEVEQARSSQREEDAKVAESWAGHNPRCPRFCSRCRHAEEIAAAIRGQEHRQGEGGKT